MKQKYFERTVDELGRIEIPARIREEIGVKEKDVFTITLIDGEITLNLANKMCFLCHNHNADELHDIGGKQLCSACIVAIDNNELASEHNGTSAIMRQVDELGRFVLPITSRRALGLKQEDKVFVYVDDGTIFIKPAVQTCYICHSEKSLMKSGGYHFCAECMEKISSVPKAVV